MQGWAAEVCGTTTLVRGSGLSGPLVQHCNLSAPVPGPELRPTWCDTLLCG